MYSGNKEQRMRGPFRLTVMVLEIIKQLELSYLAVNQPSRQTQIIQTQGVSRPTNPSECQTLLLAGAFHLKLFQFISLFLGAHMLGGTRVCMFKPHRQKKLSRRLEDFSANSTQPRNPLLSIFHFHYWPKTQKTKF